MYMARSRVEGGRTYLGRPAIGLEFKTEEREIASDQVAGVSKGRSSCASSEGPNGPRKGIKGSDEYAARLNNRQAAEKPLQSGLPDAHYECSPDGLRGRDRIGGGE